MTLGQILGRIDTLRPNAWTPEQKTAWVSDLEAILWTQIFLQNPTAREPYSPAQDDERTLLLLPDGWQRVYIAYLCAMIDLANGEYDQFQNSMSQFNGVMAELGAWYADTYDPAGNPAQWTPLGLLSCDALTGGAATLSIPWKGAALLALEWRVTDAFDGDGRVRFTLAETGTPLGEIDIISGQLGAKHVGGLTTPPQGCVTIQAEYTGDALSEGQGAVLLLCQQPSLRHRLK